MINNKDDETKDVLYVLAGFIMAVAAVAFIVFLNLTIPATFVWPGISKFLVAAGIVGVGATGVCLLEYGHELLLKASEDICNSGLSNQVEKL